MESETAEGSAPVSGSTGDKPKAPITIDVESEDEVVLQIKSENQVPVVASGSDTTDDEKMPSEKERKLPLVIPVDEDEEHVTVAANIADSKPGADEKQDGDKLSPRKRRKPEIISLDEDDEAQTAAEMNPVPIVDKPDEEVVEKENKDQSEKGTNETEAEVPEIADEPKASISNVEGDADMAKDEEKRSPSKSKLPEVISLDEEEEVEPDGKIEQNPVLNQDESVLEKEETELSKEVIHEAEVCMESSVTDEPKEIMSKETEEDVSDDDVSLSLRKKKSKAISLDQDEIQSSDKIEPEPKLDNPDEIKQIDQSDEANNETVEAKKSEEIDEHVEPICEEKVEVDLPKDVCNDNEEETAIDVKTDTDEQDISSNDPNEEKRTLDKIDETENPDSSQTHHDAVLVEDMSKCNKPETDESIAQIEDRNETSEDVKHSGDSSENEISESIPKAEEGEECDKSISSPPTAKETLDSSSPQENEKSSSSPPKTNDKDPIETVDDAKTIDIACETKISKHDEDDDDVIMIDCEPDVADSSKADEEKVKDSETSEKTADSESNAKKTSVTDSVIEVSDFKSSEGTEIVKDTKKDDDVSTSSEKESDQSAEKKGTDISDCTKNIEAEKTFVLDEKLGIFQEKAAQPEEKIPQLISGDSDEDVVMIEDDDPAPQKKAAIIKKPDSKVASSKLIIDPKLVKPKAPKVASVDCVNPECKKQSKETAPAPGFVLSFFGVSKKCKRQRVCVVCYDNVVLKYSEMCGTIVDQQPLLFCTMPQKNELVEISDSSEEEDDDTKQESGKALPSDLISLVETELEDILASTFEKINLSQQIDWTEQIMKQKIAYNTKLSDEINNELNELQRKVDRIHLNLYSKSRPKYHDLPPCNIFHEVDLLHRNQNVMFPQSTLSAQQTPRQFSPQKAQPAPQQQQQQQQPLKQPSFSSQNVSASITPINKSEEFVRPAVVVGQFYFAVKHKLLSNWSECQVVEAVNVSDKSLYKINFLHNQGGGSAPIKVVPAKYLAYRHSFNVKLPLGTRVIARFDAGTTQPSYKVAHVTKSNTFYPGIIAESFGKYNRHRYLIFFDDGYAQYVSHGDVRVVCEESKDVWLDIHPHSQDFIRNYLLNYRSQRPMVQVKVGQRIITEWKGKWIYAKVVDIDASLVQLLFPEDNRFEWIYRGSTRLGPLYQEKALSMSKMSNNKFSKFQKRNEPSIEYITLDDDEDENDENKQQSEAKKQTTPQEQALQSYQFQSKTLQQQNQQTNEQNQTDASSIRSVAKKSTFHRAVPTSQPSAVFMNSSTIYCEDDRPKGKIVYYTAKKHLPPLKYKPHECNPNCLFKITHNLKSYSPLAKPLLSGWERQLCKTKYKKVYVVYRAPCGRRLRNMYELHKYLRLTQSTLNVENYDFDAIIHCLAEYVIENHIYHNPDLSDGREFMAVPCVNYFDDTKPPPCIYSTERIPSEGVHLNLDTDFLCGCDCEDDCIDKTRCQCWQLTIAGAKFGNPSTSIDNIGYVYKRLQETVVTGIYECNARCKCNSSCLNRVVQHPLQTKLQVFKTSNRGWGIRCLNDVSKGSFICIYSGHLLTEEAGNMICQMNANKAGDEYFADLDYIETVEQLKEGYETDVVESESEADSDEADYDSKRDSDASDDEFKTNCNPSNAVVKTRSQARRDNTRRAEAKAEKMKLNKKKEDTKAGSDDEREMVNLVPDSEMMPKSDESNSAMKYRSVRKLFGKHEQIYIMDAKKSGNLGRYFNHSCNPNLFVQNVFVDTHDLRFPWVAFFALSNIRAGSELTWNYNYDVGSVPGKVLYCQCGAESCRQRLL
ncbi:histone-lysine N-methyltransferase eggless [Topomyia yanbarensis]|uniref:histone-lysine N-methyltransferase eggless n=1 Tax=Topomyia yanbarensis TaxID=2498891 RepID=UPI00273A7AF0|nr:histone-lysine N-methyltransferase eggless [Topomyia yanbarensis]